MLASSSCGSRHRSRLARPRPPGAVRSKRGAVPRSMRPIQYGTSDTTKHPEPACGQAIRSNRGVDERWSSRSRPQPQRAPPDSAEPGQGRGDSAVNQRRRATTSLVNRGPSPQRTASCGQRGLVTVAERPPRPTVVAASSTSGERAPRPAVARDLLDQRWTRPPRPAVGDRSVVSGDRSGGRDLLDQRWARPARPAVGRVLLDQRWARPPRPAVARRPPRPAVGAASSTSSGQRGLVTVAERPRSTSGGRGLLDQRWLRPPRTTAAC